MIPAGPYLAPTSDDRCLWDLWLSSVYQPSIVAADEIGLFVTLADAPGTIAEVASRLQLDERATGVLLRLLAALRLLVQREGRYQLTHDARTYLVSSSPYYWAPMAGVAVSDWHRTRLLGKLRQRGSDRVAGPEGTPLVSGDGRAADAWASGHITLDRAREVAERMHAHSVPAAMGVAQRYDWRGVTRVLDVGGGSGVFMIAAAQENAHLQCTVMDLPAMCEVAQGYVEAAGVSDRVGTAPCDMFRHPWPRHHDALFFSNVWHDWNVHTCEWLAARAFDALAPGGRILLHEMLLDDDGDGPVTAAAFSMMMLLLTQGQQFTLRELTTILEKAGFERVAAVATHTYYSVVTGHKPAA